MQKSSQPASLMCCGHHTSQNCFRHSRLSVQLEYEYSTQVDYHQKQVSKVNNNQEGVLRDGGPQGKSRCKKMVEIKGMVRMEEWYLPSAHVHMSQNVPDRTNWKSQKPWFYLIPPELLAWEPSLKVSVPRSGPQNQPKMLLQVRSLIARILKPTQTGSIFPVFLLIFHSKKQN